MLWAALLYSPIILQIAKRIYLFGRDPRFSAVVLSGSISALPVSYTGKRNTDKYVSVGRGGWAGAIQDDRKKRMPHPVSL
jgi:hypothetical protein